MTGKQKQIIVKIKIAIKSKIVSWVPFFLLLTVKNCNAVWSFALFIVFETTVHLHCYCYKTEVCLMKTP